MLYPVTLTGLGPHMVEACIVAWLVKEGDIVSKDQPIIEVATDKADLELYAPVAGRIVKLRYETGEVVSIDQILYEINTALVFIL
jgi:pyruvate/2-oxoglutarate dehydrogenase complex dihydrolipoamide acyltransferase (E2) component